jgi:co-chaperonin GroES (HSP10)
MAQLAPTLRDSLDQLSAEPEQRFVRPLADNVIIEMLPEPSMIGSIHVPDQAKERKATQTRRAKVLACGPGHYAEKIYPLGSKHYTRGTHAFVPMGLKEGDVILVLALAGSHYTSADLSVPRHNPLTRLGGDIERRVIREDEAIAVLEDT